MQPDPPDDPGHVDPVLRALLTALADTLEAAIGLCAGQGAAAHAEQIAERCGDAAALARTVALLTGAGSRGPQHNP